MNWRIYAHNAWNTENLTEEKNIRNEVLEIKVSEI